MSLHRKFRSVAMASFLLLPQFIYSGELGTLTREVWTGIDGAGVWHLQNSERFHKNPNIKERVESFEALTNWGEQYGQRLRGYLIVPSTGVYRFWIAGNANCEFWLSSDDSQFNKRRLCYIQGMGWGHKKDAVGYQAWKANSTQQSPEVSLVAGEKYFIEILHKERVGEDHVSLAWSRGNGEPEPVSFEYFEGFDVEPQDKDGDNLPDVWEEAFGLDSAESGIRNPEHGPLGDPDGDGWANWEECQNGMNPRSAMGKHGYVTREIWRGLWGVELSDLFESERFYQAPDHRDLVEGLSVDMSGDDLLGLRLRGYLTPELSGDYEFWISGDDNCEFSLSASESKFESEVLCYLDSKDVTVESAELRKRRGYSKKGDWDKFESQRSKVVQLEAGKSYFFEVLLKEGLNAGFVEVAWQPPNEDRGLVPAKVLSSYMPTSEDWDNDELPTMWEETYGLDAYVRNSMDDSDGDLIPAWLEYQLGSSPKEANVLPGALHREVWANIPGQTISELWRAESFYGSPTIEALFVEKFYFGSAGDTYAQRIRTIVKAPASGEYEFWIAGNENCELWLSSDENPWNKKRIAWIEGPGTGGSGDWVPLHKWDIYPTQKSAGIVLEKGQRYYLEVLHKEGYEDDHIGVSWKMPGKKRMTLGSEFLTSMLPLSNDRDQDSLPDDWELEHRLSASDNGIEDRGREGQNGDFDGDGLTNLEEYQLKTKPSVADTDGDGVSDGDELKLFNSNPLRTDVAVPAVVASLEVGKPSFFTGELHFDENGSVTTAERRGELVYDFTVHKGGYYLIRVTAEGVGGQGEYRLPVRLGLNGSTVGYNFFSGELGQRSEVLFQLPFLKAGTHQVTIDSENLHVSWALQLHFVELLEQRGEDANKDGVPDWLSKLLDTHNRLNRTASYVSPACVEGVALWPETVKLTKEGNPQKVFSGINKGWFSNVNLNTQGVTEVFVSFDSSESETLAEIDWLETDLLSSPENIFVRVGDSLKLVVGQSSGGIISLDGEKIGAATIDSPLIQQFNQEGVFRLKAVGPSSREITLHVLAAEFGEPFSVVSGNFRKWDVSKISDSVVFEGDEILAAQEFFDESGGKYLQVSLPLYGYREGRVLARAGANGPVLDVGEVVGVQFAHSSISGDHRVIDVLEDGTLHLQVGYVLDGEIPENLRIILKMWVPDTVFANGLSELILTAEDFDGNGVALVDMFRAPGDSGVAVCHTFELFHGEEPINP